MCSGLPEPLHAFHADIYLGPMIAEVKEFTGTQITLVILKKLEASLSSVANADPIAAHETQDTAVRGAQVGEDHGQGKVHKT